MNKLGVKKWLAFALVLVSAIACFSALNISSESFKAFFSKEAAREVDYIDIGLEYKDGWYLIKDSEDYYAMRDAVNSGVGQGLKYRLENDIEVDSRAGLNVFSGTLDGNNHSIIPVNNEPKYEEDIKAGAEIELKDVSGFAGYGPSLKSAEYDSYGGDIKYYGYGILSSNILKNTTIGGDGNVLWANGGRTYVAEPYIDCESTWNVGAIGVLYYATVENLNISYTNGDVVVKRSDFFDLLARKYSINVGGICGYAYHGNIKNCTVSFDSNSKIRIDGGLDGTGTEPDRIASICGRLNIGSIVNCLVITADGNSPLVEDDDYVCEQFASCSTGYYENSGGCLIQDCHIISSSDSIANLGGDASFWEELSGFNNGKVATTWSQFAKSTSEWVCMEDAPLTNGKTTSAIIQKCFVQRPSYTITADPGDGKWADGSTDSKTSTAEAGTSLSSKFGTPTRDGYEFLGWFTATSGGSRVYNFDKTQTVYAQWNEDVCKVYIELSDGSEVESDNGWTDDGDGTWYKNVLSGTVLTEEDLPEIVVSYADPDAYKIKYYWDWVKDEETGELHLAGSVFFPLTITDFTYFYSTAEVRVSQCKFTYPTPVVSNQGVMYSNVKYNEDFKLPGITDSSGNTLINTNAYTGARWKVVAVYYGTWTLEDTFEPGSTIPASEKKYGRAYFELVGDARIFNITLDLQGGTIKGANPIPYTIESERFQLEQPTKKGYTFLGWTQNSGDTPDTSIFIYKGTIGDRTYTAHWSIVTYTITYHEEGGNWDEYSNKQNPNPSSFTIETDTFKISNPSRPGYTFTGWTGKGLSSASLEVVIAKGSYDDRVYTATWSANKDTPYTVYHYKEKLNIADPDQATASHWDLANTENLTGTTDTDVAPNLKTYDGFEADSEVRTVTILGNGSTVVSYYYTRNSYELTVSANGGSFSTTTGWTLSSNSTIATKTFDYDENYSFPSVSRSNYTFAKWATATSGGSTVTTDTKMGNADATIYAQWTVNIYEIKLDNCSATSAGTATIYEKYSVGFYKEKEANTSIEIITNPTRTGYTFGGYYTAVNGSGDSVINSDGKITADDDYWENNATIYAKWTANKFTIAFNGNGNTSGSTASVEATYDAPITLTSNGFVRSGYDYKGWATSATGDKVHDNGATLEASQVNEYYLAAGSKAGGTYTLYANWTPVTYTITFVPNGGAIRNYTPGKATGLGEFNTKNNTITYTIESVFDLPNRSQVFLLGYTTTYWEVVKVSGVRDQDGGNAWVKDSKLTTDDNNKTAYKVSKMVGNVELKAHWEENKYNINLNANNGSYSSTLVKDIGYTNVVTLTDTSSGRKIVVGGTMAQSVAVDWSLSYDKHKFVGWAVTLPTGSDLYNGAPNYKYIYANEHNGGIVGTGIEKSLEENLSQNWGTKIIKDGNTVQSITLGDYEGTQTVNVYAIWTPVYTLTLNAGIPEDVLKNTTDAGIFTNGTRLMSGNNPITAITKNNNYFEQYLLYAQNKTDVFITPEGNEKFFYYGYYIKGWKIMIGGTYYKYEENSTGSTPIDKWSNKGTINDRVLSGTNMQYLQGDISATAVWEALTFDVRFQTKNTESYKQSYKDEGDKITAVTFNNPYEINENDSVANRVLATNILGYLPIYAHPHKEVNKQTVIDTTLKIAKIGAWNYRLDYIQYSKANYASTDKTKDVDWFIVVEGYYSPDLYRLELNLQLPYTDDNDFKLNQNDYVLEEESVSNLQSRYESLIISGSEYVADENYANRQGKVYKDGDKYYIYLLQDQIVENEKVYARYDDGKEIENATTYAGKLLPTFEIAYYQMQYYYTLNNSAEVNMYPVCGIDEGEYSQGAKEALGVSNKEDKEIKKPDWKYSYCNVNYEDYPQDYKLNVYWYRNIINVDIINVLENHHSINGYTLITETEQVTKDKGVFKLKDHKKYHLVIYTLNDSNIYEYATYAFDSLNLLKNVKYEYAKIINLFEIMSVADLANEGIIKASTNSFPIYFGNSVKVEAVDQREDDSLDVFIGYRFNEYKYQIASETCTLLVEYDNYSNDPNNAIGSYAIDVNLQNYEHGKNGNTTNYFADKDKVSIQTHFDKIKYVFNYKVTDENYVEMPYGSIRFNYSATQIQKNHFSYTVTVDSEQWLKSRIQIRLGSELVRWDLRNSKSTATSTLTEDYIYSFATNEMPRVQIDGQTVQFVVDASFLRTHLYELDSNGKPYQTNAEQVFGDINAICKDIMFDIAVRVDDLSNGEKIREYRLADEGLTNALFTMDVNKVSIDNTYVLNMLSKQDGDEYVYYYQNGVKYVIRKLYIQGKSRNILETEFVYPSQNLGTISMNVSHELLDGCINYSQFTQVDLDNRLITFCVEVAPTYVLTFKISNNEYDIFKGDRQLLLGDTLIAQGKETVDENGNKDNIASELKFTNNSSTMEYLGYWGQQALFVFNANKTHYRAVKLTDKNGELYVGVNGNSRYSITDITEVIIELIPKTYQIDAYVVYQDVEYNTIDEAVNGRKAITELVNASGIQIFAERGIEITVDSNNASSTTGVFYPGDKIYVKHTLNSAVAKDFNVSLYNNGVGPDNYVAGKGFEIQFGGENIVLKIAVTPKIEAVTITSNMPEYAFGEIYVQVNDQDAVKVEGEAILTLINGDQLTIYTKEDIAYEFLNQYTYTEDNTKHNVTTTKASGEYDGFDTFNLFEGAGFSTDKNGIYVLAFRQIPIDIEFKYYEIIPQVEEVQAGSNYTAVSDTSIIHEGTIITLTQGIDTEGYRFVDYSYGASSGEARKELALTDLGNSQYEFTMDRPLLEYIDAQSKLSSGELEEGQLAPNLKFVIYINFIKQYKYELEDISEESYVVYKVADINGNDLLEGQYYDYGTQFNIIAQTADIEHYRIEATITNSGGVEEITSINRPLDLTEVKETNRLNLSGFTILKTFDSDYTILLKAIAEEYHTTLKQSLYLGEANVQYQEIELNDGTITQIDVNDTIYYEIDATYLYGSLVTINVYVMNSPTEGFDDNQYYVLDLGQLKINGNDSILTVNEQQKTIDEKQYTMYQLTYNLSGHLTENADPAELEIVFNAMYYIKIV